MGGDEGAADAGRLAERAHVDQMGRAQAEVLEAPRPCSPSTPKPCASSTTSQASWRSHRASSSGNGARSPSMLNTLSVTISLIGAVAGARAAPPARRRRRADRRCTCARARRAPSISEAWLSVSEKIVGLGVAERGQQRQVGHVAGAEIQRARRPDVGAMQVGQPLFELRMGARWPLIRCEAPLPAP